jgi:DNA repair protein RadC
MKLTAREEMVIDRACRIMERSFVAPDGPALDSSQAARRFVALKLGRYRREVFLAIWLNAQFRVIAVEEVSKGTITQTVVYGREIARSALEHNAAAVMLAHNHPGGSLEFSPADRELTASLRRVLAWIDVKLIDHLLVGNGVASLGEIEAREERDKEIEAQRAREVAREARKAARR